MFSFIIFISLSINHHLNEDIWCQKTHLPCRARFASPEVYSVGGISIRRKYLQEEMSSPRLPGQASPTQGTVRFHRASFCPPSSVLSMPQDQQLPSAFSEIESQLSVACNAHENYRLLGLPPRSCGEGGTPRTVIADRLLRGFLCAG